jgi:UDP-N-acetylglucosamine--N-acetylmuramyl-(pentapeptide) pyrophosphoryl-undecaprenol N-acetylglucosamine transferase
MSKKIILTGGGTAGHVTPNIALIPGLKEKGYEIKYIGSYDGIEKKLIEEIGIDYQGISSGKLRRYLSAKNFSDPFRVIKGYKEALKIFRLILYFQKVALYQFLLYLLPRNIKYL